MSILAGLNGSGWRDELVLDGGLTLAADERNMAKTARFKTARGETPGPGSRSGAKAEVCSLSS